MPVGPTGIFTGKPPADPAQLAQLAQRMGLKRFAGAGTPPTPGPKGPTQSAFDDLVRRYGQTYKQLRQTEAKIQSAESRRANMADKLREAQRRAFTSEQRASSQIGQSQNRAFIAEQRALGAEAKFKPKGFVKSLKAGIPRFMLGAAMAGGIFGGNKLIQYIRHRHEAGRNFENMMSSTPSLKAESPELVRSRFDTLQRFAPTIARDPLVSGSIVRHWVEFPAVTADALKSVTSVEHDVKGDPNLLASLARMAGGFGD